MVEYMYNDGQFYFLISFLLWIYIFYLGYLRGIKPLLYLQFIIVLPMTLQLIHSSYIQGIPFGYALATGLILTSGYYTFMPLKMALSKKKEGKQ